VVRRALLALSVSVLLRRSRALSGRLVLEALRVLARLTGRTAQRFFVPRAYRVTVPPERVATAAGLRWWKG
jgi:hypothetical protein